MKISLHSSDGILILTEDETDLDTIILAIKPYLDITYYKYRVQTKDLVMAIKRIEEERDAKRGTASGISEKSGVRDDRATLDRTICNYAEALIRDCIGAPPERVHISTIIITLWDLLKAESCEDARHIYARTKRFDHRPIVEETWDL